MTIIVFLVDTSASMNQRAYVNGRKTLLDISKEAVEVFVKQRQKSPESRGDRYMLLTFDEFPRNIKAGWKENLTTFMTELKNLEASGMTTMGSALKAVFDTLNINRMQSGIDMYGQGRYPYYLEPAVIVVVTDGGKLTTSNTVQRELNLPMSAAASLGAMSGVPGAELTREPFRWDQRLYALVLRMAGHPPMSGSAGESGHVASDSSPIDAMCEVTGGRSYAVTSSRVLHQCIESLVQKLQSGVVIHFEKIGSDPPMMLPEDDDVEFMPDCDQKIKGLTFREGGGGSRPHTPNPSPSTAWHSCRKLIYVQRSAQKGFAVGFWPLPEAFWPDVNAPSLPQRSAHPTLKFTCTNQEPMIIDNLPFDKYELEPSPLTLFILGRKQPNYCWQVFIQGSTKNGDTGHPFGYLKASTNLLSVNLFVLPYNYPMLLPLLDELFKQHRLKPTNEWRAQFHNYLRTMPTYYAGPLRRVLTRMGAGNLATGLIPEAMDNSLSYSVLNYLKRLKNQAKMEYDKIVSVTPYKGKVGPDGIKVIPRSPLKRDLVENPVSREAAPTLREQLTDFPGYMLGMPQTAETHPLRNPYDIARSALLDQVVRMRANFLGTRAGGAKLVDDDTRHSLPIGQMGNYQDYLKKQPVPLREIESAPVRQHMFGNPFKINKNLMMTDEVSGLSGVDEVQLVGPPGTAPTRGVKRPLDSPMSPAQPKRKKGALPRDYQYRGNITPPVSPKPEVIVIKSEPLSSPPPPPPLMPVVNGVKPVYPGGKMAAFKLENEIEEVLEDNEPLVILEEVKRGIKVEEQELKVNNKLSHTKNHKSSTKLDVKAKPEPVKTETLAPLPVVLDSSPPVKVHRPRQNGPPASELNGGPKPAVLASPTAEVPAPAPAAASPKTLSEDELRSISLRNNNVRQLIYKEVKRPGKRHENLWEMLAQQLHGPPWVRSQFIMEVRQEAIRFKRQDLANLLESRCETLSRAGEKT